MALEINDDFMVLRINGAVIASARFSQHAAADGHGAWTVSSLPGRLLTRNQAITALTVTELLETGHANDEPLVMALREELR
jgi:hypothetical protein